MLHWNHEACRNKKEYYYFQCCSFLFRFNFSVIPDFETEITGTGWKAGRYVNAPSLGGRKRRKLEVVFHAQRVLSVVSDGVSAMFSERMMRALYLEKLLLLTISVISIVLKCYSARPYRARKKTNYHSHEGSNISCIFVCQQCFTFCLHKETPTKPNKMTEAVCLLSLRLQNN